jgi:hypothetical protein
LPVTKIQSAGVFSVVRSSVFGLRFSGLAWILAQQAQLGAEGELHKTGNETGRAKTGENGPRPVMALCYFFPLMFIKKERIGLVTTA